MIELLQDFRNGGEDTMQILIKATSGEIEIVDRQMINSVLDFLLKELRTDIAKELEHE